MWKPFAAAALLFLSSPARAGVVMEMEQGAGGRSTIALDGDRLRVDVPAREETTIFDGGARVVYQINGAKKVYQRLDEASARATGGQLRSAMAQAAARLPPELRAKLEAETAPAAAPAAGSPEDWTFQANGERKTIAGYRCEGYRLLRRGVVQSVGCFIPWSTGVVTHADMRPLRDMARLMEQVLAAMVGGSGMAAAPRRQLDAVMSRIDKGPGVPAEIERVDADGSRHLESRLLSVKREPVPSSRFELPAGLTRVDPFGGR